MVGGQTGSGPGAGPIPTHEAERQARAHDAYAYHKAEAHEAALALREMGDRRPSGFPATILRMAERIGAGVPIEQIVSREYLEAWSRALGAPKSGAAPHCLGL